jgi:hypothetical protein
MIGFWNFDNIFQISTQFTSFSSCPWVPYSYVWPNKAAVWRDSTSWTLSYSIPGYGSMVVGDYVIF